MNNRAEGEGRTFRGRSLDELVPRIREELGPDAMVVRQTEDAARGVGRLFRRKKVELEVVAAQAAAAGTKPEQPARTLVGSSSGRVAGWLDTEQEPYAEVAGGQAAKAAADAARFVPSQPPAPEPVPAPAVVQEPEPELIQEPQVPEEVAPGMSWVHSDAVAEPEPDVTQIVWIAASHDEAPEPTRDLNADAPAITEDPPSANGDGHLDTATANGNGAVSQEVIAMADPFAPIASTPPLPEPVHEPVPVPAPAYEPPVQQPEPAYEPPVQQPEPAYEPAVYEPEPVTQPEPVGANWHDEVVPAQPGDSDPDHNVADTEPVAEEPVVQDPAPAEASPVLVQVVERLMARGISSELAHEVASEALNHLAPFAPGVPLENLAAQAFARRVPVAVPRGGGGGRVVAFAGLDGSGTTGCVSKLAAIYAAGGTLPVMAVALRPADGGAELAAAMAPHGIAMNVVHSLDDAERLVNALRREVIVVLDTRGVTSEDELDQLAAALERIAPDDVHLAVPATMGAEAARDLIEGAQTLNPTALAVTQVDEGQEFGAVIEMAIVSGLPLSFVSGGSGAEAGLQLALADEIARELLA